MAFVEKRIGHAAKYNSVKTVSTVGCDDNYVAVISSQSCNVANNRSQSHLSLNRIALLPKRIGYTVQVFLPASRAS